MSDQELIFQFKEKPVQETPALPDPILVAAYHDTNRTMRIGRLNRTFRGFMIGSIFGLLVLLSPILYIEAKYRVDQMNPKAMDPKEEKIVTDYPKVQSPSFQYLLNQKYMEILKPVDPDFSIIVPKIGINSRVIANVDPADKKEYEPALKKGAAHAKGTYLPGENGTTYIFAHSTNYEWFVAQYNAIFYLLKDVEVKDQVHLVYNGQVYPYIVTDKKIVGARDIEYMTPHKGREQLILQTCWPPGTTDKRLLIFAEPAGDFVRISDLSYSLDK